jgi:predicted DNA-binding transcriptional regulator AlpA
MALSVMTEEFTMVDLKFIMADTGFGKTFIYDRIKSGDLPKAKVIH